MAARKPVIDLGDAIGAGMRASETVAGPAPAVLPAAPALQAVDAAAPAGVEMVAVRLPRDEPKLALNVKVPWSCRHGLELLARRNGTTMQDEVAAALASHFAASGFTAPSFFR